MAVIVPHNPTYMVAPAASAAQRKAVSTSSESQVERTRIAGRED